MMLAAPRVPILLLLAITLVPVSVPAEETDRVLRKEITIDATIEEVWHAWTSADGLAPVAGPCNVELRVGGPYEWFLVGEPDESGRRGSEGARVLAFLPHEMFAFDWTFPPAVPTLRASGGEDAGRTSVRRARRRRRPRTLRPTRMGRRRRPRSWLRVLRPCVELGAGNDEEVARVDTVSGHVQKGDPTARARETASDHIAAVG
jgi:uncharacterized protein YndB with AHSA1/START domain